MFNNKFIAMVGGRKPSPKTLTWSAFGSLRQVDYPFKGAIQNVGLALVADEHYPSDGAPAAPLPPHLCFPLQAPVVLDPTDPIKTRLDVIPVLENGTNAMYVEEAPIIQYPVKPGERFSATLECEFMILLPEAEDKDLSIQPIFKWQPDPAAYESIVVRFLRNDMGETSLDITHFGADGSSNTTKFDFDQFVLNDPRMFFNMVVTDSEITVTVNAKYSGSLPYTTNVEGPGHFIILTPEDGEQGANIAEVYRVALTR